MQSTKPTRIEHWPTAMGNLLARQSAIALLERSIDYGHRHIAVIRFAMAVATGAEVTIEQRKYCEDVAATTEDPALRVLVTTAMQSASLRCSQQVNAS
jgi:hypothetical protein